MIRTPSRLDDYIEPRLQIAAGELVPSHSPPQQLAPKKTLRPTVDCACALISAAPPHSHSGKAQEGPRWGGRWEVEMKSLSSSNDPVLFGASWMCFLSASVDVSGVCIRSTREMNKSPKTQRGTQGNAKRVDSQRALPARVWRRALEEKRERRRWGSADFEESRQRDFAFVAYRNSRKSRPAT